ncbi:MAG: hypothetical protein ACRELC_01475, partial [Gemmatimonadota bacterium]
KERSHVVAALLACLELARQQVLRIEQVQRFGSIWVFAGAGAPPRAAADAGVESPDADDSPVGGRGAAGFPEEEPAERGAAAPPEEAR